MQLIARHGFKNNAKEYIEFATEDADRHPDSVPKGARFSIGGDKKLDEMKAMQKHRDVIRQLLSSGVIGDASDTDLCKKIDAEVVVEKRQREEASRLVAAGSQTDALRQAQAAGWTPPSTARPAKGPLTSPTPAEK